MALTYCVLASGSGGNALWVRGGGVEVLVDCGLSARRVKHRLAEVGGDLADVSAVLCTHGHGDHVAGTDVLSRRHDLDVWATAPTLKWLSPKVPDARRHPLQAGQRQVLGGLTVEPVATSHDAPGSVGFILSDGETRLGVVTDLGRPTEPLLRAFEGVDGLVLEMNHDFEMLWGGPYPASLKARVSSERGHLSNDQGAEVLGRLCHPGLQHVTLAHLSEHNNTPGHALAAAEAALDRAGHHPALVAANQHVPGAPVILKARQQLGLPLWGAPAKAVG